MVKAKLDRDGDKMRRQQKDIRQLEAVCDAAVEVVEAYIERFHVKGRGLVGPIDTTIRKLIEDLRQRRWQPTAVDYPG